MSEPMDTVRDILYPGFSAKVTPIRPTTATGTTAIQYVAPPEMVDDDLQAAGDDYRDRLDGWRPDPKDLA
jgi:hypothetical protein